MTMKSDNTWKMWGVSSHDIKLEEDFKWRKLCYFSYSYRIQSEASSESEWERNVIKIKRDSIFMAFLRSLSLPCSHSLSSNQHKNWSWLAAAATKERELHKDTLGVNSIYDFFFLLSFLHLLLISRVKVSFFIYFGRWHKNYFETHFVVTVIVVKKQLILIVSCCLWKISIEKSEMDLRNLKSVFIIAEIGQNHQGDIKRAKEVIKFCFNPN